MGEGVLIFRAKTFDLDIAPYDEEFQSKLTYNVQTYYSLATPKSIKNYRSFMVSSNFEYCLRYNSLKIQKNQNLINISPLPNKIILICHLALIKKLQVFCEDNLFFLSFIESIPLTK